MIQLSKPRPSRGSNPAVLAQEVYDRSVRLRPAVEESDEGRKAIRKAVAQTSSSSAS
jgi:hypothetical protein